MAKGFDSGLYRTFRDANGFALDTGCDLCNGEIPETLLLEGSAAFPVRGVFGLSMPQPIDRFTLYVTNLTPTSQDPNAAPATPPPVLRVRVKWGYNQCNVIVWEKDVALTTWDDAGWVMQATGLLMNTIEVSASLKIGDVNIGAGARVVFGALVDRCGCCTPDTHDGPFVEGD